MSDSEIIRVILVASVAYMIISSWYIAKIADEVHTILQQLKGKENNKVQ